MLGAFKRVVLRLAKVPAEPNAPAGSPGSLRVFRAGENYWKYLLVTWGVKQVVGGFFIILFLSWTGVWVESTKALPQPAAPVEAEPSGPAPTSVERIKRQQLRRGRMITGQMRFWANAIHTLEWIGLVTFTIQIPFSLAAARLNYEMRWYIVTDRSLRIREGIFGVREMTLTFANVQNITVGQGPLQRLLGLADVVVRTAGGGGSEEHGKGQSIGKSMHVGTMRAVDDAIGIRDLILERLRRLRDAGLGDPDDRHATASDGDADALRSAIALRDAARALSSELGTFRL